MKLRLLLLILLGGGIAAPLARAQQAAPPADPQSLLAVADRLFATGRFDEARPIYLRLLPNNPRDFHVNRNLGHCFANSARPDLPRAIEYFETALAAQEDEVVRIALAGAYIRAGRPEDGLRFLRALADQHPQHPEHWREYAEQLFAVNRPAEAVTAYRAYLERSPGNTAARVELGRLLLLQGDGSGAMAEYRLVLQTNPRDVPARIGVARLLGWENQLEASLRGFESVLAEAPQNAEAQQGRAQVLLWMGRLNEAEPIFQNLARRFPNNPELRAALDQIAQARQAAATPPPPPPPPPPVTPEQPPETVEGYLSRVAQNPEDRVAHQWLSEYYALRQEWPEAVRHAREVVRLGRDDAVEFRLAQLLGRAESYDEAATLLRGLSQRSTLPDVDLELGAMLRWSGRPEEALPFLNRALAQTPDNPDALGHRAQVRAFLGQPAEAIEDFNRLLAQRPADADALIGKANATASLGDFEAAVQVLTNVPMELAGNVQIIMTRQRLEMEAQERRERAIVAEGGEGAERVLRAWLARNPNDADAAYSLGERAAARNNYVEAVNFLRQALAARPDMKPARLRLAQVLSFNRSYEDAVVEYDFLLRDDPRDPQALLESARVRSWAENYSDSVARYRRYLALQPDPTARLDLARVYTAERDYPSALAEYDVLAPAMPDSRDVLLERAQTLLTLNRYGEAIQQYDEALVRFPNNPDLLYGKGRALYFTGELEEADRVLTLARRQTPAENPDLTYALANVARARGYTGRALDIIPPDTPHVESQELRSTILTSLRPELRLLFSGEHATEFLSERAIQPDLGLRTYRGNARLSFWLTPDVRAQLDFNSIPSFAGRGSFLGEFGDTFVSNNVLFTLSGSVTPRIRWTAGGGGNAQTSGTEKLLGLASLGIQVLPYSNLTVEADRMMIDYTPRAIALNVSRSEYRAIWDTVIENFLRLNATYAHGAYSTTNHSNAGSGTVEFLFPTRGGNMAVGYTYQAVSFTRAINAGFFTPEISQRHLVTSRFSGLLGRVVQYELHGTIGPHKSTFVEGDPRLDRFSLSGTAGGSLNWNFSEAATVGAGYDFAKASYATGAYRSHTFLVFWRYRF